MSTRPNLTPMLQRQLVAIGTTLQTSTLATQWLLLYAADAARIYEELQPGSADADFRSEVYYRTATVRTDEPGAWTTATSTLRTPGAPWRWVTDLAVTGLTGKMWIQFAVKIKSNAAGVAECFEKLRVGLDNKAAIVAARTVQIQPVTNTSQTSNVPLCDFLPAQDLAGFMAGMIVSGVSGTLDYGIVYRTADGDPSRPGAWTNLASYTGITADETRNSGDLAVTPGTKLLVQPGLKFSGNAWATIQVMLAARRS